MSFWADFFSFAFPRNLMVHGFLGFSTLTRTTRSDFPGLLIGSLLFLVNFLLLSAVFFGLRLLFDALGLSVLHFPLAALSALGLAYLNGFLAKIPPLEGRVATLGEFLFNSAYFGGALMVLPSEGDWIQAAGNALGAGTGFVILNFLYWGLRHRWTRIELPSAFQGWPVTLITLGFAGLVFLGLGGIAAWGPGA